jgi:methionine--tRNA ligase beta chain
MVSYEDFKKLEIRVGKVISAEKVPDADKLLTLVFDMGDHERQVVAGIAEHYEPDALIGRQMPVLVNLESKTLKGLESNGMILAADADGRPVVLSPDEEVPPGSVVK